MATVLIGRRGARFGRVSPPRSKLGQQRSVVVVKVAEIDVAGDELDAFVGRRRQVLDVDRTQRVELLVNFLLQQQQLDVFARHDHFRQAARATQVLHLRRTHTRTHIHMHFRDRFLKSFKRGYLFSFVYYTCTIHRQTNSRSVNSRTSQLADSEFYEIAEKHNYI